MPARRQCRRRVAPPIDLFQLELVVSWGGCYLTHNARFVTLRAQNPDPNNAAKLLAQPASTPTMQGGQ